MKKYSIIILFIVLGFITNAIAASDTSMGIVTGGEKGTYYQIGLNIKDLIAMKGFDLNVANSKGSIENIYAVYKRPNTQLGIVQSDALAFIAKIQENKTLKQIAKKIRMVFPLYNEEVHLLARDEVQSFEDLEGRIVAIGSEESGTYLTTKLLFEISGIVPAEMIKLGTERALTALKSGQIDAMFYVAGQPVNLFTENVTIDDRLKLLPITNKSIMEVYPITQIPAETYSFQPEAIDVVAVKAVLISYDFRRTNCDNVGVVAKLIYDNMETLKELGHPKWETVDLDYPLVGWDQYVCVKKYLNKPIGEEEVAKSLNPILNAINEMLK